MKEIFERKSIRRYTDEKIEDEKITKLLKAAMAAPSAMNNQGWEFIVIKDKITFKRIMEVHKYSQMLKEADTAILVCGNDGKSGFSGYWIQDCAAATENILLEAEHLGLGAVWLGLYPEQDRVKKFKEMFNIPEDITPFSIVALGYPAEKRQPEDRFDRKKVHYEVW